MAGAAVFSASNFGGEKRSLGNPPYPPVIVRSNRMGGIRDFAQRCKELNPKQYREIFHGTTLQDLWDDYDIHLESPAFLTDVIKYIVNDNLMLANSIAMQYSIANQDKLKWICESLQYDPANPFSVVDQVFSPADIEAHGYPLLYKSINNMRLSMEQVSMDQQQAKKKKGKGKGKKTGAQQLSSLASGLTRPDIPPPLVVDGSKVKMKAKGGQPTATTKATVPQDKTASRAKAAKPPPIITSQSASADSSQVVPADAAPTAKAQEAADKSGQVPQQRLRGSQLPTPTSVTMPIPEPASTSAPVLTPTNAPVSQPANAPAPVLTNPQAPVARATSVPNAAPIQTGPSSSSAAQVPQSLPTSVQPTPSANPAVMNLPPRGSRPSSGSYSNAPNLPSRPPAAPYPENLGLGMPYNDPRNYTQAIRSIPMQMPGSTGPPQMVPVPPPGMHFSPQSIPPGIHRQMSSYMQPPYAANLPPGAVPYAAIIITPEMMAGSMNNPGQQYQPYINSAVADRRMTDLTNVQYQPPGNRTEHQPRGANLRRESWSNKNFSGNHQQQIYNPYGAANPGFSDIPSRGGKYSRGRGNGNNNSNGGRGGRKWSNGSQSRGGYGQQPMLEQGHRADTGRGGYGQHGVLEQGPRADTEPFPSFEAAPDPERGCGKDWIGPKNDYVNQLWISELPMEFNFTQVPSLKQYFEGLSQVSIKDLRVMTDKRGKPIGYLDFFNADDCRKVFALGINEYHGFRLDIHVPKRFYQAFESPVHTRPGLYSRKSSLSMGAQPDSSVTVRDRPLASPYAAQSVPVVHEEAEPAGVTYSPQDARSDFNHPPEQGNFTGSPESKKKRKDRSPQKKSTISREEQESNVEVKDIPPTQVLHESSAGDATENAEVPATSIAQNKVERELSDTGAPVAQMETDAQVSEDLRVQEAKVNEAVEVTDVQVNEDLRVPETKVNEVVEVASGETTVLDSEHLDAGIEEDVEKANEPEDTTSLITEKEKLEIKPEVGYVPGDVIASSIPQEEVKEPAPDAAPTALRAGGVAAATETPTDDDNKQDTSFVSAKESQSDAEGAGGGQSKEPSKSESNPREPLRVPDTDKVSASKEKAKAGPKHTEALHPFAKANQQKPAKKKNNKKGKGKNAGKDAASNASNSAQAEDLEVYKPPVTDTKTPAKVVEQVEEKPVQEPESGGSAMEQEQGVGTATEGKDEGILKRLRGNIVLPSDNASGSSAPLTSQLVTDPQDGGVHDIPSVAEAARADDQSTKDVGKPNVTKDVPKQHVPESVGKGNEAKEKEKKQKAIAARVAIPKLNLHVHNRVPSFKSDSSEARSGLARMRPGDLKPDPSGLSPTTPAVFHTAPHTPAILKGSGTSTPEPVEEPEQQKSISTTTTVIGTPTALAQPIVQAPQPVAAQASSASAAPHSSPSQVHVQPSNADNASTGSTKKKKNKSKKKKKQGSAGSNVVSDISAIGSTEVEFSEQMAEIEHARSHSKSSISYYDRSSTAESPKAEKSKPVGGLGMTMVTESDGADAEQSSKPLGMYNAVKGYFTVKRNPFVGGGSETGAEARDGDTQDEANPAATEGLDEGSGLVEGGVGSESSGVQVVGDDDEPGSGEK